MDRLIVDAAARLNLEVLNFSGILTDLDAPPTIAVYDGGGNQISTEPETLPTSLGTYSYIFFPTVLDQIYAVWSGLLDGNPVTFTTYADVVGGVPLTVADIRALDEDFADTVKYPTETVQTEIDSAIEHMERLLQVALVPRGRRVTLSGSGTTDLTLPNFEIHDIITGDVSGSAITPADVSAGTAGVLYNAGGWSRGTRNVTLHYTHGWDFPPEPVLRALKLLTVERMVKSALPARATSLNTDVGAFRITVAGRDGYTGIPDVDSVIDQFGYAAVGGFA